MKMDNVCCPYQDPIFKKPLAEENTNCMRGRRGRWEESRPLRGYQSTPCLHYKTLRRRQQKAVWHQSHWRHIAFSNNCDHLCLPGETEESLWESPALAHNLFWKIFFVTTSRAMCHTCCQTGHTKLGVGMLLFFIWTGICVSDLDILPMFPAPLKVEFQKSTFRRPCGPI